MEGPVSRKKYLKAPKMSQIVFNFASYYCCILHMIISRACPSLLSNANTLWDIYDNFVLIGSNVAARYSYMNYHN